MITNYVRLTAFLCAAGAGAAALIGIGRPWLWPALAAVAVGLAGLDLAGHWRGPA
ncbi:MAG: hypothetical protein KGJ66_03060 [Alphaproteobacteria bacterium]|nr:hypothetical protein [Alphaproteobacteria bacterium]